MRLSPLQLRWRVSDIERLIIPPYRLEQFSSYRTSGRAAGLATWAYLSDQCANEFSNGTRKMQPNDWRPGSQLWFIDVLAPFGGIWSMVSDLRTIHGGTGLVCGEIPTERFGSGSWCPTKQDQECTKRFDQLRRALSPRQVVDSKSRCNGSMRTGFARLCQAL
jgi:RTX toxin acyltransferase family